MGRKVLLLMMVVLLTFSSVSFASENDEYAENLEKIGVFQGTGSGFELDREPTRVEGLIMFIRLLGKESEAVNGSFEHPFNDVPTWANNYVGWAYENGYTQGVSSTEFGSGNIEAKSYLTFMLRALNYDDSKGDFSWASAIDYSKEIGLIDNNDSSKYISSIFKRDDVAKISYNILKTKNKDGVVLAKVLSENGSIDSSKLIEMGINIDDNDVAKLESSYPYYLTENEIEESIADGLKGFSFVRELENSLYKLNAIESQYNILIEQSQIITPKHSILRAAAMAANSYNEYSVEEAQSINNKMNLSEMLAFEVIYLGSNLDSHQNVNVVLRQGTNIFKPYSIDGRDEWGIMTDSWPNFPAYQAFLSITFFNSELTDKIDFSKEVELIIVHAPEMETIYKFNFNDYE